MYKTTDFGKVPACEVKNVFLVDGVTNMQVHWFYLSTLSLQMSVKMPKFPGQWPVNCNRVDPFHSDTADDASLPFPFLSTNDWWSFIDIIWMCSSLILYAMLTLWCKHVVLKLTLCSSSSQNKTFLLTGNDV